MKKKIYLNKYVITYIILTFLNIIIFKNSDFLLNHDELTYILEIKTIFENNNIILYKDIIETNPPFIISLYLIPYFLNKIYEINEIFYYFQEIFLFFLLTIYLIERIFEYIKLKMNLYNYIILLILMLMPIYQYGQRDHLIIFAYLPFFILRLIYIENKNIKIKNNLNLYIVTILALSLFIKPHFVFIIIITDILFFKYIKNKFKDIFKEYIIFLIIGIIGIITIYIFTPFYFVEISKIFKLYSSLEFETGIIFKVNIILIIILYLMILFSKINNLRKKYYYLIITIIIFTIFIQNKFFSYHFIPLYVISLFLIYILEKDKIGIFLKIIYTYLYLILILLLLNVSYYTYFNQIKKEIFNEINNKKTNIIFFTELTFKSKYIYINKIKNLNSLTISSLITAMGEKENYKKTVKNNKKNLEYLLKKVKKEIKETKKEYIILRTNIYKLLKKELFQNYNIKKQFKYNYILIKRKNK